MRFATRSSPSNRVDAVDALRGLAVAMMVAYHFCYDLGMFGLARWSTADMVTQAGWIGWRTAIVSMFLTLVGVSMALRRARGVDARGFWLRWLKIAGAAALVSLGSWVMFGPRFIYFGVLHFVAVALLLLRASSGLGVAANALLGLAALGVAALPGRAACDAAPCNISGLYLHKPWTEDFVPLAPWLGPAFLGLALGLLWLKRGLPVPAALVRLAATGPVRMLSVPGRWSLSIYLVHQPVLIGALMGWRALH
ncbi:heparan-alpha-glucosaminide N-acetyltransferase [Derxia lacustris]|uniref:heparan-alpha-glucosaminide N-acetyltransferase n=1 Tax=Derxia lacustris TaxID=764842 RepID=UPI000A177743|nr:heparan-alpha-glucosaminide N-acetyltransferase [Derxia lacustris]